MKIEGFQGKYQPTTTSHTSPENNSKIEHEKRLSEKNRPRPDESFKIKDAFRQINQTQPVVKLQKNVEQRLQLKERTLFDEAKVIHALERYIQEHSPEPTVRIALTTHRPEVQEEQIVLAVDNQLQWDKLDALKMHLQNSLMKYLNNGYLQLSFKLFDVQNSQEEKKLFTAGEKFQHFLEINPVVADLKNIFGLELE